MRYTLILIGVVLMGIAAVFFVRNKPNDALPQIVPEEKSLHTQKFSRIIDLKIENGKIQNSQEIIQLKEGEDVIFKIVSDLPDELHIHGYDISAELGEGVVKELNFAASKTGRFIYELEHAHIELGAIEVMPK